MVICNKDEGEMSGWECNKFAEGVGGEEGLCAVGRILDEQNLRFVAAFQGMSVSYIRYHI